MQKNQHLPLIIGILITLITMSLDQLSKWWIITKMYIGDGHEPDLFSWLTSAAPQFDMPIDPVTPYFNLVMVWNSGVSFGLFNNPNTSATILSTISLLISGGFFMWMVTATRHLTTIGCGMIVGGAIANVWDRLRFGAVADFFDVHVMGYHWPAFNIADAAIVLGVVVLMIDTLFFDKQHD